MHWGWNVLAEIGCRHMFGNPLPVFKTLVDRLGWLFLAERIIQTKCGGELCGWVGVGIWHVCSFVFCLDKSKLEKYCLRETAILVEWCWLPFLPRSTLDMSRQIQLTKSSDHIGKIMHRGNCYFGGIVLAEKLWRMFAPFFAEKYSGMCGQIQLSKFEKSRKRRTAENLLDVGEWVAEKGWHMYAPISGRKYTLLVKTNTVDQIWEIRYEVGGREGVGRKRLTYVCSLFCRHCGRASHRQRINAEIISQP